MENRTYMLQTIYRGYKKRIIKRYKMANFKPATTPIETIMKISARNTKNEWMKRYIGNRQGVSSTLPTKVDLNYDDGVLSRFVAYLWVGGRCMLLFDTFKRDST